MLVQDEATTNPHAVNGVYHQSQIILLEKLLLCQRKKLIVARTQKQHITTGM